MRTLRLTALVVVLAAPALAQVPAPAPAYRVIVNPRSSVAAAIERDFLADAFMKKVSRWPNGEAIMPVDLNSDSPVRRRFSDEVLKRSLAAVRSYWQQLIFSGRGVPPPELDTDQAVIEYVSKHRGAVGYVSGAAQHDGVKVVSVR